MPENARIVDIFFRFFFNQRAYTPIGNRHFEHAIDFMAAFVVLEGNAFAVVVPLRAVNVILVAEQFGRGDKEFSIFPSKNARHLKGKFVAGLGIFLLMKFGMQLVGRRGFYIVNVAFLYRADTA